ncbi:MAG: glutamate--tRNA ligase [Bacteriovoracaceae bacterium]|jgi:glutamyl-tRNA synthetase|nr:glutamate--tRNA ligase [Bacteriovoracaceae bacterium]
MSVRVRFAPSPTGYLHIGGARTALYNYLLAKSKGGKYILRVEDTDEDRSEKKYEDLQIEDLKWAGVMHDEGAQASGDLGPYHQSQRLNIYMEHALKLIEEGKAFYDFCTDEELEKMKEENIKNGTSAYTGKWRNEEFFSEAKQKVANGEKASIRFKVDESKAYSFKDLVRSDVKFPAGMVGDFVIMRSSGIPTYNFCNVIDDHLHQISHVLRGEEHLNNTVRQLMIYEAFSWQPPKFAHLSIMIGSDRQKLSKRHGATSVHLYKEEGYLPQALMNYLCLLGWSHPEEKSIFTIKEIENIFDETRFNKSPAMYDIEKLKWTNAQHLKLLSEDELLAHARDILSADGLFMSHDEAWQRTCLNLLVEKIQLISEIDPMLEDLMVKTIYEDSDETLEIKGWETTPQIASYIKESLESVSEEYISSETFSSWMNHCKKELGIKGKPLFMGFRYTLTGKNHGPDLKILIPLIPVKILKERLKNVLG